MEFTYKISGIKVYSTEDKKDIIKEATLHIIGTENNETYESYLPLLLEEPSSSFTEFEEVTEGQVQEGLKATLGEDQIEENKKGLASLVGNPMFSKQPTRDNPQEKELNTRENN